MLEPQEAATLRQAAAAYLDRHRSESLADTGVFSQLVNVWRYDDTMRELTLHPRLARIAAQLAGVPVRIWHDQLLVKEPHSNTATEFHQDRPYWPHDGATHSLSAWTVLVDVPPERGCVTFLPGTHRRTGLSAQDLHDSEDLFTMDPELRWSSRARRDRSARSCGRRRPRRRGFPRVG